MRSALTQQRLLRTLATVADQGLVSGASFVLTIILARHTLPDDYGLFVLASSAVIVASDLQNALLLEPMLVFGPTVPAGAQPRYMGAVALLQLAFGLLVSAAVWLACLTWAAAGGGYAVSVVGMMGLALLGAQAREFTRKVYFAALAPGRALAFDAVYLILLVVGVAGLTVTGRLSGITAFALLATVGLLASTGGLWWAARSWHRPWGRIGPVARRHWTYGRWMIGVTGARWAGNELYLFVAAGFLGPAGTAALKAIQNVFAPVALTLSGFANLLLPVAARLAQRGGIASLRRLAIPVGIVLGGGAASYVVAVTIWSEWVVQVLYGGAYAEYAYLIPLLGTGQVLIAAMQGPSVALRALDQPRAVFLLTMVSAAVTVASVFPFTAKWGLAGAASAMILSLLVGTPLWILFYRRATRLAPRGPSPGLGTP